MKQSIYPESAAVYLPLGTKGRLHAVAVQHGMTGIDVYAGCRS